MNPKSLNISIETFDKLNEEHKFSDEYKAKKRAALKEYKKSTLPFHGMHFARIAVAACLILVVTPIAANAATGGEFWNRIWGNFGKGNVASHDEVVFEAEKGTSYTVTYPQRDYEAVDPQKAEELIGDNVSFEPIVKQFGDTTLTILSSVTDGNAAVVEFTLEREGGVNALNYSQLNNEAKGADFSDDADFYFDFKECSGSIFVDLEKSTSDKLYCYNYMTMTWGDGSGSLTLETEKYPCTRKELSANEGNAQEDLSNEIVAESISIPLKQQVETIEYTNPENGCAAVSPLSLKIDMTTGLGLTEEKAYDPYSVYYTAINYKDGTNYVITDQARDGLHSCETEIDNSSYVCGGLDNSLTFVFNRLVDTAEIDSITVNETTYTLK